jgi:citrate lyase subunit beta / citryl-CoA lyase
VVRIVRVNGPADARIGGDLDAVVRSGLDGVMIPAVQSPEEVRDVSGIVDRLEEQRGIAPGSIELFPLVETAFAARFAYEIAVASPRVAWFAGSTADGGDIARALGYRWSPTGRESYVFRSWVLICARAAGIDWPISGVWTDVPDLEGLRAFALEARDLGYRGLMAIHPSHVPVINDVFTPSSADVEHAHCVIAAVEQGRREGIGAVRLDGRMLDEAHVKSAHELLSMAARFAV